MNLTKPTQAKVIKRSWHLIDVKDQIIGRVVTNIAHLLMGKSKPYYARNMDCGDYVVVINSALIKSTGSKETKKMYHKHSGIPGGFKEISLKALRIKNPNVIVAHAVAGMIPNNKIKSQLMKRLYVFPGESHKYKDKFKSQK